MILYLSSNTRAIRVPESGPEQVKSDVAKGAGNTTSPLTQPLDLTEGGLAMDATRTCTIPGCERPYRARGWCATHWSRWRKHGSPERRPKPPANDSCVVEGCGTDVRSAYSDYCEMHYGRLRRAGTLADPVRVGGPCLAPGCTAFAKTSIEGMHEPDEGFCRNHTLAIKKHGDLTRSFYHATAERNPLWTGDDCTYGAVHQRVRKRNGKAANHSCVSCGGRARQWAYDHSDPDGLFEEAKGPYSTDLDRYQPMCVRCHKRLDMQHLRVARGYPVRPKGWAS